MLTSARLPTPLLACAVALSVAVPGGTGAAAQERPLPPGFASAWGDVVEKWRATNAAEGIVGASLAFVADGRVVARAEDGMADLAGERPVDEETIYHWASITKTFTAVAIMQLRDRGLVALDDPVVDYVPELRGVHNPFGPMEAVTLRHLLSHSAGFRGPTWPWAGTEPWHPHEPTEWSQLVAMIPYTEVLFEPGSRYAYSNPGIVFLGRVLEAVTGDVYEAYVDKNVFRPLGMRRAYFDVTPWHLLEHRSNNYRVVDGEPVADGLDFNTGITVSNGGLNAPLDDMARWIAFLAGTPLPDQDAHAVLSRSSLEEMWREVVPVGETELGHEGMGLSFFLYRKDGNRVIGHTGSQKSFISFLYVDPATGAGALAAFNTNGGDETGPDSRAILNALRVRVFEELLPLFRSTDDGAGASPEGGAG
ncbi:MAG TPA: serine hydrolase domain-containing protein [Longimicrobiales bacterium]|nr:serine hydrolase domain-containing protein [Longimicrobiales bacterium]